MRESLFSTLVSCEVGVDRNRSFTGQRDKKERGGRGVWADGAGSERSWQVKRERKVETCRVRLVVADLYGPRVRREEAEGWRGEKMQQQGEVWDGQRNGVKRHCTF